MKVSQFVKLREDVHFEVKELVVAQENAVEAFMECLEQEITEQKKSEVELEKLTQRLTSISWK